MCFLWIAQVLINNAGVLQYSDFDSVRAEELLSCFQANAIGPLIVAQQLHRRGLIGGGRPTLIGNVTSKVPVSTNAGDAFEVHGKALATWQSIPQGWARKEGIYSGSCYNDRMHRFLLLVISGLSEGVDGR